MEFNYKIRTFKDNIHQFVDYVPTPKQEEFHQKLNSHKHNILRKSRGVGGTTTIAVEAAERLISLCNYSIGYVPPMYTVGAIFMDKLRDLMDQHPNQMGVEKKLGGRLKLSNGSHIKIVNNPDQLCGERFDWLIFDDCFQADKVDEIMGISRKMDSERTLIGTPPEGRNPFKRYYYGAMTQLNEFEPTDYLWYDHPRYSHDLEWVRDNVRIPHDNSNITAVRLLEFGFHRESPTYTKFLRMFGHDYDYSFDDFSTYSSSTYSV